MIFEPMLEIVGINLALIDRTGPCGNNVRSGSSASFRACASHFRFTPNTRNIVALRRTDVPGQQRTHAPRQTTLFFDNLPGELLKMQGTSRPSAFAVLSLIVSTHLIGACTGKSAGFSPLRMRSAGQLISEPNAVQAIMTRRRSPSKTAHRSHHPPFIGPWMVRAYASGLL